MHTAPLRRALAMDSRNLGVLQCSGLSRDVVCKFKLWPLLLDSDNFEVKMWKADDFSLA